jgi:hypothetical protein
VSTQDSSRTLEPTADAGTYRVGGDLRVKPKSLRCIGTHGSHGGKEQRPVRSRYLREAKT